MRSGRIIAAAVLFVSAAWAQDAAEVLKKTGETYRNANSFQFKGQTVAVTSTGNTESKSELSFDCALVKPGKVLVEYEYPNAGNWVRVSDGKTFTRYRSVGNTFAQEPASPDDVRALSGTPVADFERIDEGVVSAKITGSDAVDVGGTSVDCYVLEVVRQPGMIPPNTVQLPTKYWIDKNRFVVLKSVSGTKGTTGSHPSENTRTVTFSKAEINTRVEDAVFAFKKP